MGKGGQGEDGTSNAAFNTLMESQRGECNLIFPLIEGTLGWVGGLKNKLEKATSCIRAQLLDAKQDATLWGCVCVSENERESCLSVIPPGCVPPLVTGTWSQPL